jgi:hypothetical protein
MSQPATLPKSGRMIFQAKQLMSEGSTQIRHGGAKDKSGIVEGYTSFFLGKESAVEISNHDFGGRQRRQAAFFWA